MARTPSNTLPLFDSFFKLATAALFIAILAIAAPALAGPDDIDDRRRFDQAAFLTAHNAFAATDLGWVYAQQKLSIREQLEYGVRGFMLDVYKSRGGRNEANCRSVRKQIKKTENQCHKATKTNCSSVKRAERRCHSICGGIKWKPARDTCYRLGKVACSTVHVADRVCKKIPYLACSPVTLTNWTTKQVCDGTKRYIPDGPVKVRLCHEHEGKKAVDCPLTHNVERPLKAPQELYTALGEIKRYLDRNRRAIVTIFFESYVDDKNMMADQFNASGINHYIFNPDSHGVAQKGWPTIGWMRAQNKRVVVLSSNRGKDGLPNGWSYVVETQYDLAKHNNCAIRGETTGNVKKKNVTLLAMNHFYGIVAGQPWVPVGNLTPTAINNYAWLQKRAKQCWKAVKRIPNFVALDFAEQGQGLLFVEHINSIPAQHFNAVQ